MVGCSLCVHIYNRAVGLPSMLLQKTYSFACNDWLRKTKEKGIAGCKKELLAGEVCVRRTVCVLVTVAAAVGARIWMAGIQRGLHQVLVLCQLLVRQ